MSGAEHPQRTPPGPGKCAHSPLHTHISPPLRHACLQIVPFSTFLTPNSLLSPSPCCLRLFFSRSRPATASKAGLLQHVFAACSRSPEELNVLPVSKCVQRPHFSLEASRTQKKEKGGYRAGHSKKKKDLEIFNELVNCGEEESVLV